MNALRSWIRKDVLAYEGNATALKELSSHIKDSLREYKDAANALSNDCASKQGSFTRAMELMTERNDVHVEANIVLKGINVVMKAIDLSQTSIYEPSVIRMAVGGAHIDTSSNLFSIDETDEDLKEEPFTTEKAQNNPPVITIKSSTPIQVPAPGEQKHLSP